MAVITVPETLTAPAVSHWDSPWLNRKFVSGLVMVLAVLLQQRKKQLLFATKLCVESATGVTGICGDVLETRGF